MSDYKKTLNLPVTSFPMKANLVQREPETLRFWSETKSYEQMLAASGQAGEYVLHDGPPYANGNIHLGTALNKILKDIVIKSQNLQGFRSEYVPGWDCHGLPIEHKVEKELGEKKAEMKDYAIRRKCRQYADKYVDIQRKEFIRLGVFGDWANPYKTMNPGYEASIATELANFVEKGNVVRSKKPIYWCNSCQTALAEAEVEYADHTSPSIYVRFPFNDPKLQSIFPQADLNKTFVIIWTTTPWTLPSNLAVALHPELSYALVEVEGNQYVLARELLESVAKACAWTNFKILAESLGQNFLGLQAKHPFYDRTAPIVLGEHVTLEAGTGAVHTAPGHGREDYEMALKYGLDVYSPLDNQGKYLEIVEFFAGMPVQSANPAVIEKLKEVGNLLGLHKISHSYPHCWRCKNPVIFRATTQWFISMDKADLRKKTLQAISKDVEFIPAWGKERIYNMIEFRPDWCISRQRLWGVPILALLCEDCNEAWQDPNWMRDIASRFANHKTGCDYWYEAELNDLMPQGLTCPHCGGNRFKRETDILDVWFDSGTSFAAVLQQRPELHFPADLYLEGSDQHRGWFHSSLLASMGTRGVPPYKAVLTHGYVVDGQGRKQSKSLGNVIAPSEVIDRYGAEILRLWVSSVDYRDDIRVSEEILSRLVEAYRRIRNTSRFLLGNLSDLTPENLVAPDQMDDLDRYTLDLVAQFYAKIQTAYKEYEFHKIFHSLHNLCATDLSAFYLDILKDRLYSSLPDSWERRSAQSALYHITCLLTHGMAPILSFTAEEVHSHLPKMLQQPNIKTVFALPKPNLSQLSCPPALTATFNQLLIVRQEVTKAIEPLRKAGEIGHGLDTKVTIFAKPELLQSLQTLHTDLRAVFIVSQLELVESDLSNVPSNLHIEGQDFAVQVQKASGEKCARCWIYCENLGQKLPEDKSTSQYPDLCPRCAAVVTQLQAAQEKQETNNTNNTQGIQENNHG